MKSIKYFLLLYPILACTACEKLVDAGEPKTMLESSAIFSGKEALSSAVAGYYQQWMGNSGWIANGGVTLYAGLSADELINVYPDEELDRFRNNELVENNDLGLSGNLWQAAYKSIFNANSILEGINKSSSIELGYSNQVKCEMLLGRALHYFYLANLFGPVPLVLTTDYEINQSLPATAVNKIYEQLVMDLEEASSLLTIEYPTDGRVRPNRFAAQALLARIYLYQQNWQAAYKTASTIIEHEEMYQLENITDVFSKNSREAIWQLQPSPGGYMNTGEGFLFNPYDEYNSPMYTLGTTLSEAFSEPDLRKNWIGINHASGTALSYPFKYTIGVHTEITEHYFVLRLAELFLVRAEAATRLGNFDAACADINIIRDRAGLAPIGFTTEEALFNALMAERRLELFCEWGHRWLDLKRTNTTDAVLKDYKAPYWQTTDQLYPIPRAQRQRNPYLKQNPGY